MIKVEVINVFDCDDLELTQEFEDDDLDIEDALADLEEGDPNKLLALLFA